VRQLLLAITACLLTLSASGVPSLMAGEPCTAIEQPGQSDTSCPPTCVTCGCCAQAVEPAMVVQAGSPDVPAADLEAILAGIPKADPHPILHVPKFRAA